MALEHLMQRKFSETKSSSRALKAFEPISEGDCVYQYFISPVKTLSSLNFYFFTYCQPNGATVKISLETAYDDTNNFQLVYEQIVAPEEISDGHCFTLWPEPVIDAGEKILKVSIEVMALEKDRQFTIAGREASYRALCPFTYAPAENTVFALEFNIAPPRDAFKKFAFISGCPGDAYRYRCEHHAEALENAGYSVDIFLPHDLPYAQLLQNYSIVVAHRVPDDQKFHSFAKEAQKRGVLVVYDVDDLVFDPARITQIDAYNSMTAEERSIYLNGVERYNAALSACPMVTVSTQKLADIVHELWPEKLVLIVRNRASETMVRAAGVELAKPKETSEAVRIAYFSGTKTHSKDFAECVGALEWVFKTYPNSYLTIVGHLDVPAQLKTWSSRIDKLSFMPWIELPKVYRAVDINLAPLEYGNDFTKLKSELKYIEAALVKVPTIACDLGAFRETIKSGVTGILCSDKSEWREGLKQLMESAEIRKKIGEAAFDVVMAEATTMRSSALLQKSWREALERPRLHAEKKSRSVAFVTRAPIAVTGGGYKKIFILAKFLAANGYDVRVHVEAIAHLERLSDGEIREFCSKNFDVEQEMIHVGHNAFGPVDIAIATNWPTVAVVANMHSAKFKAYFIQDFEPEFYSRDSREDHAADQTYNEKLAFITIGQYLAERLSPRRKWIRSIPFAVDECFHAAGRKKAQSDKGSSQSPQAQEQMHDIVFRPARRAQKKLQGRSRRS